MLRAAAEPDSVGVGVEVAEVIEAPLAPLVPLGLEVMLAAADVVEEPPPLLDSASVAFIEPHVTDWHPACPSRSSGWLATQLVFHCSQMKKGRV